jgi:hypothetical protein
MGNWIFRPQLVGPIHLVSTVDTVFFSPRTQPGRVAGDIYFSKPKVLDLVFRIVVWLSQRRFATRGHVRAPARSQGGFIVT